MSLSAWCAMPPGITKHDQQHKVCDMRLKAGQIASCSCPDHPPKTKDAA